MSQFIKSIMRVKFQAPKLFLIKFIDMTKSFPSVQIHENGFLMDSKMGLDQKRHGMGIMWQNSDEKQRLREKIEGDEIFYQNKPIKISGGLQFENPQFSEKSNQSNNEFSSASRPKPFENTEKTAIRGEQGNPNNEIRFHLQESFHFRSGDKDP